MNEGEKVSESAAIRVSSEEAKTLDTSRYCSVRLLEMIERDWFSNYIYIWEEIDRERERDLIWSFVRLLQNPFGASGIVKDDEEGKSLQLWKGGVLG